MNMKNVFLVLALLGTVFAIECVGPIPIDSDTTLNDDYIFCTDGFIAGADNIVLDCNGHTLQGINSPGSSGVVITDFNGITVKNCDISEFSTGIYAEDSQNHIFEYNDLHDNGIIAVDFSGIHLTNVMGTKIRNNDIYNNDLGIGLEYSDNNEITDNNLWDNSEGPLSGICLSFSDSNTISGNDLDNNGEHGIRLDASSYNTIDDNEIYEHAHGIYLNLQCTGPCTFSDYNTITNNEIYDNGEGIMMYSSSHNTIDSNDITDNTKTGIYMQRDAGQSCDHNTITKNNILRNGEEDTGIRNYEGDYNYIAENVITDNEGAGIKLSGGANYNTVHDNTIERNDVGVHLEANGDDPTGNNITSNDILNNTGDFPDAGVYLDNTVDTYVYNNVIKYNDGISRQGGVVVSYGEDDVIEKNTITYSNHYGVFVYESTGTQVLDNTIGFNVYSGVRVYQSDNILIDGNTIRGNGLESPCGVEVEDSTPVTITDNTFRGNSPYGIRTDNPEPEDYPDIRDNEFWIELLDPENNYWMEGPDPEELEFVFDYSNVIPCDERPGTLHGECALYVDGTEVESWTYDEMRGGRIWGYVYEVSYADHEWWVECFDDGNNEIKSPHFNIFLMPPDDEGDEEFNPEGGSDTQELFPGVTLTVTGPGSIDINWMLYNTSPSGTTPFTGTGLFLEIDVEDPTEQVCFEIEIDPAVVSALGIDPASLTIFHYNGASWEALSTTVTGSYTLTACTNEFSMFGVGGFFASDSKNEEKEFDVTYEAICPGDQLEVTVEHGSDTVSGAEVRLVRTNPWEGTISEQETSAGKVTFDLTDEGTYEVHVTKSGYRKEVVTLEYSMCGESEEPEEVTPPAEEETPPAEEVEPAPEPEEEEVTETADAMNEAEQVISDAQAAIDTAKAEGKDTTEAEAKLREAEEKFQMEDFAAAKQLAEEAKALLEAAAPAAPEEEAPPTEEEEPAPVAEPEEEPEPEQDYSWVLWLVVIVIIVGAGYWYFTQPKKKRK